MPWEYIHRLLGPGLHWSRTQEELRRAIEQAERDRQLDAAEHIRIILRLRNKVMCDDDPADR